MRSSVATPKHRMLRTASGMLALLVLNACSGSQPATSESAPAPADKPAAPPPPAPPEPPIVLEQVGFKEPESVLHDAQADVYLVSNLAGKALEKDGEGFISKLSPDGKLLALRFIDGGQPGVKLDAPKGMAIAGDELFVADIDSVRVFDRVSGKPLRSIAIEGASFLNDVTVGADGALYVTDSGLEQWGPYVEPNGKDAVYRVQGGTATALIKSKALGNPNGIALSDTGLLIVNKGGQVLSIGADGARSERAKLPKGSLDGVVATPEGLFVSSWDAKMVYLVDASGSIAPLATKVDAPADIGFDAKRRRLLIPQLTHDTVRIQPLP